MFFFTRCTCFESNFCPPRFLNLINSPRLNCKDSPRTSSALALNCADLIIYTLWLFNIAMENGPFIDEFLIKTSICKGFSMAMLNNQRVYYIHTWIPPQKDDPQKIRWSCSSAGIPGSAGDLSRENGHNGRTVPMETPI